MSNVKYCIAFLALMTVSSMAVAGNGTITPATLMDDVIIFPLGVTAITPPIQPGAMQVFVHGDFKIPPGLKCTDNYVIETRSSADPGRLMYQLLVAAAANGRKVVLGLTDDPAANASPGRCSLTWVGLYTGP